MQHYIKMQACCTLLIKHQHEGLQEQKGQDSGQGSSHQVQELDSKDKDLQLVHNSA